MADIELVIKIPEEDWEFIKESDGCRWSRAIIEGVINGTPLPKGHGDLIDRDSLVLDCDWSDYYDGFSAYSESQVRLAPIIIEADKEDAE